MPSEEKEMSAAQKLNSDREAKLALLKRQYDERCRQLKFEYENAVRREKENFSRFDGVLETRERAIRKN